MHATESREQEVCSYMLHCFDMLLFNALSNSIPDNALGGVDAKVHAGLPRVAHLAAHNCYHAPAILIAVQICC